MARKNKRPTPAFPDLEAKRHHATRNESTLGNWLCLPGRFRLDSSESPNMQMINTKSKLEAFVLCFSITAVFVFSISLTTGHCSRATRYSVRIH